MFALATLGDVTQIEMILFVTCHPKWLWLIGVTKPLGKVVDVFA
jgi:hypothetical protein